MIAQFLRLLRYAIKHTGYHLPGLFPTQNSFCESFNNFLSLSIIFHMYNSSVLPFWLRHHEYSHYTKSVLSENNSSQICARACPLCPWKTSRNHPSTCFAHRPNQGASLAVSGTCHTQPLSCAAQVMYTLPSDRPHSLSCKRQ